MAAERRWLGSTVAGTLGAFAVAAVLAPPASASAPRTLTWLLFLTSSVHVASTGFLFSLRDVRHHVAQNPARYVWAPIGLVLLGGCAAAALTRSTLAWPLLAYFGWQQWHYQKQNLGIAALTASSRRLPSLSLMERRALQLSGIAGIGGLVTHPGLLQLDVHSHVGPLFALSGVLLIGTVVTGVVALSRRAPADRPVELVVVYVIGLLFSAPVFLFSNPYAAVGGMTIAHGLQYLLLVGLISNGNGTGVPRLISVATFANVALIGGVVLNGASHLHSSGPLVRAVYGAYLGLVMAHFVVDAGLWRLRDPAARAFVSARLPYLVPPRPAAVRALVRA